MIVTISSYGKVSFLSRDFSKRECGFCEEGKSCGIGTVLVGGSPFFEFVRICSIEGELRMKLVSNETFVVSFNSFDHISERRNRIFYFFYQFTLSLYLEKYCLEIQNDVSFTILFNSFSEIFEARDRISFISFCQFCSFISKNIDSGPLKLKFPACNTYILKLLQSREMFIKA